MASRPRRKPKLSVVKPIGTGEDVVDVLSYALTEAQDDELLAVVIVKVYRHAETDYAEAGAARGFRHLQVAGCTYALNDLVNDD
jgi:sirohydrochlorin ferrochelatase